MSFQLDSNGPAVSRWVFSVSPLNRLESGSPQERFLCAIKPEPPADCSLRRRLLPALSASGLGFWTRATGVPPRRVYEIRLARPEPNLLRTFVGLDQVSRFRGQHQAQESKLHLELHIAATFHRPCRPVSMTRVLRVRQHLRAVPLRPLAQARRRLLRQWSHRAFHKPNTHLPCRTGRAGLPKLSWQPPIRVVRVPGIPPATRHLFRLRSRGAGSAA